MIFRSSGGETLFLFFSCSSFRVRWEFTDFCVSFVSQLNEIEGRARVLLVVISLQFIRKRGNRSVIRLLPFSSLFLSALNTQLIKLRIKHGIRFSFSPKVMATREIHPTTARNYGIRGNCFEPMAVLSRFLEFIHLFSFSLSFSLL